MNREGPYILTDYKLLIYVSLMANLYGLVIGFLSLLSLTCIILL